MEKGYRKKGLDSIKTMKNVKKISAVKAKESSFLELYILEKEKERLLMERQLFAQKLTGIKRRLNEIETEVERIQLARGYSMKNLESKKNPAPTSPNKKEQRSFKKVQFDY